MPGPGPYGTKTAPFGARAARNTAMTGEIMAGAVRKAVFPVAGLGTRFLPATRAVPKELLAVVGRPLIDYAIAEARDAGIETFIFVTGLAANADALRDHLCMRDDLRRALEGKDRDLLSAQTAADLAPESTVFVTQEAPLGLGHAVWCARDAVGEEPFAVILPDDLMDSSPPAIAQLIDVHEETGGSVLAVMDVPREATPRYGIVDPGASEGPRIEVRGLVEKPAPEAAPSTLSVIGRYVLVPEVFAALGRIGSGSGGEIQLTDALAAGIGLAPLHGLRVTGRRYDCGSKAGFAEAQIGLALRDPDLRPGLLDFMRSEGAEWE